VSATLLAAGAVIASFLAKPIFDGDHPHGFAEIAATVIGLLGSGGVLGLQADQRAGTRLCAEAAQTIFNLERGAAQPVAVDAALRKPLAGNRVTSASAQTGGQERTRRHRAAANQRHDLEAALVEAIA
jgi:hypothetical protein